MPATYEQRQIDRVAGADTDTFALQIEARHAGESGVATHHMIISREQLAQIRVILGAES